MIKILKWIQRHKANKVLKSIGINTKHKSINRVLEEISAKWNTLSDDKQKEISITLAGQKDKNKFVEIMKTILS